MYKIIGKPFRKYHSKYAELECGCGHKTIGALKGNIKDGYTSLNLECKNCKTYRQFGTIEKRLNNYIIDKNNCHIWQGLRNKGNYSIFSFNNKNTLVHRFVWEYYNNKIPKGVLVRHKCDNPSCINLKHLELGNYKDNANDMVLRGRAMNGEKNHSAKLTSSRVKFIRESKQSIKALAKFFKVSISTITKIKANNLWKHIK